jgi:oxygen-independent coproporphyrinogen-3 oxidase
VQSFDERLLSNLGRNDTRSPQSRLEILSDFEFKTVDIDLIFGIPGQTGQILREDFLKAIELGATQISAYPFIDFSYAHNKARPMKKGIMKQLLNALVDVAKEKGFERSSVWTFKKRGSEKYSSITRDLFIGMGPSATTLTLEDFYINTFSVPQYCSLIESGQRAISLNQVFTQRTRMLYWLFWSCYEMKISREAFSSLFNEPIERVFGHWLNLGCQFKFLEKTDAGYTLTQKGAYSYHLAEQALTHAYIDKTWKKCHEQVFPEGFKI